MQTFIAQAVALACHANARLRGVDGPPFFPGNSTCQFCEYIRFVERKSGLFTRNREAPFAEEPRLWMDRIRDAGAQRVRLGCQNRGRDDRPDFDTTGFAGGGSGWWLLVDLPKGRTEGWIARWEVGDRETSDRRIWRVTYGMPGRVRDRGPSPDLGASRDALAAALEAILGFSLDHLEGAFSGSFRNALAALRGGERHGYHRDLAPDGVLSGTAIDLLDACQSAWVFGGMGSWNDLHPGDAPDLYDRVTADLYRGLCDAIVAAANDSAR
jgi:hypothetical protein